jgi:hypothetical protein
VKKNDFLKKWAKRASGEKSVEEFERDVESVLATTIRAAIRGVARGIEETAKRNLKPWNPPVSRRGPVEGWRRGHPGRRACAHDQRTRIIAE